MRPDPFIGAPSIKSEAIFLADSHYNPLGRIEVLPFLEAIGRGEVKTPQLFLMGDICDALIGRFRYCRERNKPIIDAIDLIAKSGIEVWYFEGNHDFFLEGVFDKAVKIVKKSDQPKRFTFENKRVWLLHGDYRVELRYAIYAAFIRTRLGLVLSHIFSLNFWDNRLLKSMENRLLKKRLRYNIVDFQNARIKKIGDLIASSNVVMEGHFHQNCRYKVEESFFEGRRSLYCNLASFACEKSYLRIQSEEKGAFLREERWER
jgi:UDP-2,3-diacylglucosamine hydrolase